MAATLVLERLTSGTYTGIDRSAAMITAAHELLRPGGRLRLAIDAPNEARARSTADSAAAMLAAGFRDVRRIEEPFDGGTVSFVSAKR